MKQTWLIVEDDPIIRSILTALMTLWGVNSIVFKDGYEVTDWLDKIERSDPSARLPDIALMDIRMPGPQGHEVAKRMRNMPVTRDIPIVIMSAYQLSREERNEIIAMAHPEHIIGKPLPAPDDMRMMLERTVESARNKAALKQTRLLRRQPQYRYLVNPATSKRVADMQIAKRRAKYSNLGDRGLGISVPASVRAAFTRTTKTT